MNKTERRTKKQLQQERINILDRQTALKVNYCNNCPNEKGNMTKCYSCDIYAKIRDLGDQLIALTYEKRGMTPPPPKITVDVSELIPNEHVYEELKNTYKTDIAIAEHLRIHRGALQRWKKANNISTYNRGRSMHNQFI